MAKKKHAEEHVNLERWLVSYADFITLLFATFVVLYALSQLDLAKFKDLKISLAKAFSAAPTVLQGYEGSLNKSNDNDVIESSGQPNNQNIIPPILDVPYAKKENSDFKSAEESFNEKTSSIKGAEAGITERGLVIKLIGNVVFEPGTAVLKKDSYNTLKTIGTMIKAKFPNHQIRVEGHTDNISINSALYPSNWELSSARASTIVRYIIDNFHIPSNRFSAVGYADSRPVAINTTDKGRESNRRVEIVVLKSKLVESKSMSEDFKNDLKGELSKFRNVELTQKKNEPPQTSDAVNNLLKNGNGKGNVIIFDTSNDAYKKDSQKLLEEIKQKEKQTEEYSTIKKKQFVDSVRKSF